ncbi:hypothetical protein L3Q67_31140 [Saccharothrix sp. AJ9571]|nr:hypothetical protein L3Q67_31140 [Saccharothrix sp. AJ9571]
MLTGGRPVTEPATGRVREAEPVEAGHAAPDRREAIQHRRGRRMLGEDLLRAIASGHRRR